MEHMWEVRRVEWAGCWEGDWSQLKEFDLARQLYVGEVVNSNEKVVLWQGRMLRLSQEGPQCIRMTPLQEVQLMSHGGRLILGNCELVLELPRLTLRRADKRCYFVGEMGDGAW